jgi:hypothetical protein
MLCDALPAASRAGDEEGILAADFESPSALLVARGPTAKPTFDRIQLPAAGDQPALIHLQRAEVDAHLTL